jgi:cytochrome d ubiquinol oxidase subunit II
VNLVQWSITVLWIGLTLYVLLAGADFGAGFWDLFAGGSRRGRPQRELIEHSIGPVWEANHVWLIFVIVLLWTSFPAVFAAAVSTLYVPMTLVALGIIVRGAAFAFRKASDQLWQQRLFGAAFALSSVLTPFFLGTVAGGIASGRVPAGGVAGDWVTSWLNPTSLTTGVLAVVAVAYLAAVYLVWEARRDGDPELAEYFRRRALVSAVLVAIVAAGGMVVLHSDAPYVFDGMKGRALPVVVVGVLCGLGALVLLARGAARGARLLAVLAVAGIVISWGVAQWPYLLPESLTVSQAAAPTGTLQALVVVVVLAAVTVGPAFVLLYVLDQRSLLPEEGVRDVADRVHD